MPLYEFACENCGNALELLMKVSDPHPKTCPNCQQDSLIKLMSQTSFVLKGKGWYETDFKTPSSKNNEEKKAAKPSKDPKPASNSSDTSKSTQQKSTDAS